MQTLNINAILRAQPRNARYGAPMGSTDMLDDSPDLYLQRVNFIDGDYGPDGTYWGDNGTPVWCAFNAPIAQGTRVYVRAKTRNDAKIAVLAKMPNVNFLD